MSLAQTGNDNDAEVVQTARWGRTTHFACEPASGVLISVLAIQSPSSPFRVIFLGDHDWLRL